MSRISLNTGKKRKLMLFSDIRFWIFLFFIVRLYGITNPPLEVAHNWRQTVVTMAARNFYEVDNNILYPRVDFAGEKTGITGMEFPFFNYLIYIFSYLFGYEHWYGRLINLIVSSFGIFYFCKLIKKYFKEQIAFNAAIILLSSIWFSYSRKIMPDTFAMSFLIASIYYGSNYFDEIKKSKKYLNLFLYFLLTALASLSKISTAYLSIIFVFFVFNRKYTLKDKLIFILVSVLSLSYTIYWYFVWVPYLVERFGFWHFFMGESFSLGIREIYADLPRALSRFYETALKYTGFLLFVFGLIYSFYKKQKMLISIFIVTFISFSVIIFKSGIKFAHHEYYIIPFVPVMAFYAANGLTAIKNQKIVILILFVIAIEGILNQQQDFRIHEKNMNIVKLEQDLDKISGRNDLILINSNDFPTPMYFAHRKGWIDCNKNIKDSIYINNLKNRGLKYIVILKRAFGTDTELDYSLVSDNENYRIYSLIKEKRD